ncbi:MAG: DNA polymerase III subunit delta [Treponema sp.]|nr:DNA polymerase III subunit delta [Treponema sp.]
MSKNVYIFLGPELGKKQDAVKAVKEKFKNAEEHIFYAGEDSVSEIANTIQNISLFADSRLVIIKSAELIKKKDEIEIFAASIREIDNNTALIFLSDETKLAVGLENAFQQTDIPGNNRQIFYEMFEREKNEWVKQFFKREGYEIDKACIDTILELIENNTDALKRECSRLICFLPKTGKITAEQIEKWLSHNREESAFTLFSRIAYGDLSKALESLAVMLAAKQSAQSILAGLTWCFRKLNDYLLLQETGNVNNNFELKKIGLSSPKAKDDYSAAAQRYNIESVEACLSLTADYDILLRSPAAPMETILMDRYIIAVFHQSAANKY